MTVRTNWIDGQKVWAADMNAIGTDVNDLLLRVAQMEAISGGTFTWASITNKPDTFPPSAHTHVAADVTDLMTLLSSYATTSALANKVDKIATANTIYTTDGSSVTTGIARTSSATANTVMQRDGNGNSMVAAPTANGHVATKAYVDARTPLTALSGFNQGLGTRKLISSMTKALAGTGVSEHLIIGDSMSSAYTGAAFDFANSWHRKLKAKLVASGYPDGGTGLIATNEANSGGKDPRWAFSGTADTSSNVYVALGTAASTATFTSDTAGTIVDVIYSNAGGSFSVKIDGAAAVRVVATGALTIGTYTVTGLANTAHTVVVTATSGSAIVCAAQVRNAAGVRFTSLGKFGLHAAGFLGDGGFVKSIAVGAMPSPDVVHISIGANDMINGATAAATVTNIQTIRNLWPSADVILYVEPITENNEISDAAYGVFATALRALASTLGCPLVDWNLRYGGAASVISMGFVGADGVHPNALAQADMGNVVYEGLTLAAVATAANAVA